MSDLTTVNNTLKEQNELLKGNRAQELENIREQARKDAEMLKILKNLKPTVNIDGKKDKDSFLMSVLKGFGLIGAGALGLAAGLTAGWVTFVAKLIGKVGKFLFKLIDKIPRPKFLDDFLAAFKAEGKIGQIFMKIKNFFIGETSVFKRIGTLVDSAIDGVKSFSGGIFTKIKNFFTADTSVFKRIGTLVDSVVDTVKGFSGGIFTKIGNFFGSETSIFKRMKTAIDPVIDIVKGMGGGIFTKIGNVFQSIKNFAASVAAPFKSIGNLLGMGGDAAKAAKGGGGIVKTIMGFLSPMKTVFKAMAGLGRILGAPLTIIMGLIDAGFETKDAVDKSKGFFATILNGIFGAIGGFIDGAIMQVADLLKDGISWIAGFFGFKEVEKTLDSFSFSEIFNKFLDGVYEFVNKMFNNPMAILRDLASKILPEWVVNKIFGEDKGGEGAKLEKQLAEVQSKELKAGVGMFKSGAYTQEDKNEEIAELMAEIKALTPKVATGGLISSAGIYNLHKGEMVMDKLAVKGFEKALSLVNMSQQNAAASGGGTVVVNNNNNVDNSVKSAAKTNFNSAVATRSNESTLRALQAA